ncbi:MAG: PilZ domain-containing protein [bacterium]|nr:PilZ domain-containing protein [bacterium]
MTTSDQDSAHRRSATRAPVGRPIKLQFDDSMDVIEGICRNVSIGGMFIVFESSRPAGSLVRFELEIDESSAIRGLGEVIWMRSKNDLGGPEPGFGLKFRFLEQRDRQLIFKLVSQHIKERLSRRETAGGEAQAPSLPIDQPPVQVAVPPDPEVPDFEIPPELAEPPAESLLESEELAIPEPSEPEPPFTLEPPLPSEPSITPEPSFAPEPPPIEPPSEPAAPSVVEPPAPETELPLFADQIAEVQGPPVTDEAFELDPSVGETPLYELGLDPEPSEARSSSFLDPEPELEIPAPVPEEDYGQVEEPSEEYSSEGIYGEVAPRRRSSWLLIPALLIVTGAIGYYLYKDEIHQQLSGERPAIARSEPANPVVGPEPTPAEGDVPPEDAADTGGGAATELPPAVEEVPEPIAPPPPVAEPEPPPSTPPPSPPPPPPVQAPPTTATGQGFSRLVDISWSPARGGLTVVLTADGDIPAGRYKYFRLPGDSPREVFKLMGARQRYRESLVTVGGPGVRQIRVGYHRAQDGNEIHVVLDLLGPRWKVTEVRNLGPRLELLVVEE